VSESAPPFPPGRYGHRRAPRRARRWLPVIVFVVVLARTVWLAQRLYTQYGDPYPPQVTGLEQLTDSAVTVVFTVHMPDSRPVPCRLQALDESGAEVGYAEVPVPATGVQHRTLATSGRARAVDILGCRAG